MFGIYSPASPDGCLTRSLVSTEHGRGPARGMATSDARQQTGRPPDVGRTAFDLVAAKLLRPVVRHGTVRRSPLIERLARTDSRPIASVVAPAGYGKMTPLSQWAERNGQAFTWVSIDEWDNDPKVLLTYVAEALNAVEPVGKRVFDALASHDSSVPARWCPGWDQRFVDDLAGGARSYP